MLLIGLTDPSPPSTPCISFSCLTSNKWSYKVTIKNESSSMEIWHEREKLSGISTRFKPIDVLLIFFCLVNDWLLYSARCSSSGSGYALTVAGYKTQVLCLCNLALISFCFVLNVGEVIWECKDFILITVTVLTALLHKLRPLQNTIARLNLIFNWAFSFFPHYRETLLHQCFYNISLQ